jgi:thymidylate kinase
MVSFSGIDGAGKSTQIQSFKAESEERGLQVKLVTFWEDVARLKRVREGAGYSIFKGDKGVGSPSAPINRRDKNVQSIPMTAVRLVIYLIDALSLRRVAKQALRSNAGVVIFDRYIYDELANLSLGNVLIRAYARFLLSLVPKPHSSFLLDADPILARARKPEYPVDFLIINRKSYLDLSRMVDGMIVVPPLAVDEVKRIVLEKGLEAFHTDGEMQLSNEEAIA